MTGTVAYNIYECPRCKFRIWRDPEDPEEVKGFCKKKKKKLVQNSKDPLRAGIPGCEFFINGLKERCKNGRQ
jgi:hypothetical protein